MVSSLQWKRVTVVRERIEGHELFPLPLTVMERFLTWDDLPNYPKRFQIVMSLDGTLDPQAWKQSLDEAMLRHPMLLATIGDYDQRWEMPESPSYQVAWVDRQDQSQSPDNIDSKIHDDPAQVASLLAKIERQATSDSIANFRIAIIQNVTTTCIAFDVQHSACDGLGMRVLIEDLTARYDSLVEGNGENHRWRTLDQNRLLNRGECPAAKADASNRSSTWWEKLVHAYHFHFRGPAPLRRFGKRQRKLADSQSRESLIFRCRDLDLETMHQLRDNFIDNSIHVNEWAIAAFLETANEFKNREGSKRHRLRVSIPIDMRIRADVRLSATNKIGFAFIVSDQKLSGGGLALIASVKQQMEMIRKLNLGNDFVNLFQIAKNLGTVARAVMSWPISFATSVVTNLGDVTARQRRDKRDSHGRSTAGDLKLHALYGWPPIRPGTQMGIGLCRYNQRLSVSVVFDGWVFTEAEVDRLFEDYVSRLINF